MNRIDACRSCHHQVVWLEHVETHRKAPIDVVPVENGIVVAVDHEGEQTIIESAVAYRVLHKGETAPPPKYASHFSSCRAAAKQFRGRRSAA